MRPGARELVASACLLALLGVATFGSHVAHGGFYNDDWVFAVTFAYAPDPGYFGAVDAFNWYSFRPASMLYLPLLYELFGQDAHLHLAWLTLMAIVMAAALYWLLRELGMEPPHAGAVAALVLVFPASDANRLWGAASIALPGITCYLLGTVLALRGLAAHGRRAVAMHAGALVLYALSVMFYEIAAGAILLSVVLYRWRAGWRPALVRWLADVAVIGTVLATVTSGSWNEPQPLGTIIRHAGSTADQAFVLLSRMAVPYGSPSTALVAAALIAVAAAGAVTALRRPSEDPLRRQLLRWLTIGLAATAAVGVGYAIFVPADPNSYAPLNPGQHNRVNGLAAIGFALLIYALAAVAGTLLAQRARRWRELSAGLAAVLAAAVGWGWIQQIRDDKAAWALSAELQDDVVAAVARALPEPPAGSTIYAFGAPTVSAPGVPVFAATWDLAGAVRFRWEDPSLAAYPAIPGTALVCSAADVSASNANDSFDPQSAPYGKAYVVDVPRSRAFPLPDRATCRAVAGRFSSAAP
ncbi:MAG: hypothetical protein QOH58_358 [Thermoleophilaceae bacterium]|nr:hypothetical protein [Thermoleophilaceae bacterium]